jgi:hypothetical protein
MGISQEDNVSKKYIMAALVLSLLPLSIGAQDAASTEFQYLAFDIGYAPGWNLDSNSYETPSLFGLNIRVADKLSAGIQHLTYSSTASDNFLLLKYSFLPKVRAILGFGTQGTGLSPASSVGFEVIPFGRSTGGATTELKVAVKYDAPFSNPGGGKIFFALALGIGF